MTMIARAAEYRYFSFTYFYGKAYFGLAESWAHKIGIVRTCQCITTRSRTGCGSFSFPGRSPHCI